MCAKKIESLQSKDEEIERLKKENEELREFLRVGCERIPCECQISGSLYTPSGYYCSYECENCEWKAHPGVKAILERDRI